MAVLLLRYSTDVQALKHPTLVCWSLAGHGSWTVDHALITTQRRFKYGWWDHDQQQSYKLSSVLGCRQEHNGTELHCCVPTIYEKRPTHRTPTPVACTCILEPNPRDLLKELYRQRHRRVDIDNAKYPRIHDEHRAPKHTIHAYTGERKALRA